jgi:hypothetical protein
MRMVLPTHTDTFPSAGAARANSFPGEFATANSWIVLDPDEAKHQGIPGRKRYTSITHG